MKNRYKFVFLVLLFTTAAAVQLAHASNVQVLNPKGPVAGQERDLIITAVLLMLIVVIPAYILVFVFARKYRAGNTKAKYSPDSNNNMLAWFLWAIPATIIFIIAIINWKSTHALDPYKPIVSDAKPLTVQVVALQWKWLFIYPEQGIATVNFVEFPERTPVHFELTADAPMNSFWIPQLGGQMYAMPGMSTQLNLMADAPGDFAGSAAEINGAGFAGMKFIAKATPQADFDQWVRSVRQSGQMLTKETYDTLAAPSENNSSASYVSVEKDLYNSVIMKFMPPLRGGEPRPPGVAPTQKTQSTSTPTMQGMQM